MKKKIIIIMFAIFLISISINQVYAKYVIEENIAVANIRIDRTSPNAKIIYSTKEVTQENVEVTIQVDEEIQNVEGWTLGEDKRTLKKEYNENAKEEIEIKDLAGNIKKLTIEVNNIDKKIPTIEIKKVTNSNKLYPNYANKDAKISFDIVIKDDRKITKSLEEKDIKILINGVETIPKEKKLIITKDTEIEKNITLTITGITKEGNLSIKLPEGTIKDEIEHNSLKLEKDTKIKIDNTKPQVNYSQNNIQEGKIEAIITSNEEIRKLEGWNLENKKILKKVFTNNLSYTTTIYDLAGNASKVEVDIKGATNIILSYASHNSVVGWSFGYGNYDIAGLEALKENPIYKTESLAFSLLGNVEKDYLQAKAYIYTHWKGSKGRCRTTGKIYLDGWNPIEGKWLYQNTETQINLNNKDYFQIGGSGVNSDTITDIYGNGEISLEVSRQYRYGISALALKLKSYEQNSICYQTYVDEVGWLKPAKNEEITCYEKTKPFSAIRVALVPNSEVDSLINTWNKDIGKKF